MSLENAPRRDLVVVGSSMGGIQSLRELAARLPDDFPAAVIIVQHTGSSGRRSQLGHILDRSGPLPAGLAEDGQIVESGRIYVAPPGVHTLLFEYGGPLGTLRLTDGPRENLQRPAVDALFRSAALAFKERVVGVVLSGLLDDGASGLAMIKRQGGGAVVQDPEDTDWPDMPNNALAALAAVDARPDLVAPVIEMAAGLVELCGRPAPAESRLGADSLRELEQEIRIAAGLRNDIPTAQRMGEASPFICPECGGPLWQQHDETVRRYRCHTGHAHTARSLLQGQEKIVEQTLWKALRSLEETTYTLGIIADDSEARGDKADAERIRLKARESQSRSAELRRLVVHRIAGDESHGDDSSGDHS